MQKKLLATLAGLILLPLSVAQAQPPPHPPLPNLPPESAGSIDLGPGLARAQVKDVILAALSHRGWTVVKTEHGVIQAHLMHRHYDATLMFNFDAARIDILSDSYLVDKDGNRTVRAMPTDWINYLRRDIKTDAAHLQRK